MKKPKIGDRVTVYRLFGNLDRKFMIGKSFTVQGFQGLNNEHIQLLEINRTVTLKEITKPTKLEKALT